MTPPLQPRTFSSTMFVRRTQTRAASDGERYFTHRLIRSGRRGVRVRQRTLLNLGRHLSVPQADWPLLCSRIEQLLNSQDALQSTEFGPSVCAVAELHPEPGPYNRQLGIDWNNFERR